MQEMRMDTDTVSTTRGRVRTTVQEGRHGRLSWAPLPLTVFTWAMMLMAVWLREGHPEHPGTTLLGFTTLQGLPLLARARWPVPVLVATVVASAAQLVLLPQLDRDWESAVGMAVYQPVPVAVMVAAFTVGLRSPRRTAWLAGGSAAAALPLLALVTHPAADYLWTNLVMANLVLDGTAAGVLIAARRERVARDQHERAEQTRREVEAERLRIARELHDVLAHHLTLVNAQASVADYLIRTDPAAAARALTGLAQHTRQALDEVRATVGLLRQPTDRPGDDPSNTRSVGPREGNSANSAASDGTAPPLPTLDQLPELIDTFRSAGTTVEVETHGSQEPLSPRGDLAAYRLIQEALTNATKHAPGAAVTVTLSWDTHQLRIHVHNPASTTPRPIHLARNDGHGLLGMAERVKAAGGTLDVEHSDSGGFAVTAVLPTDPSASRAAPDPTEIS
jgi:signal transduction histidine kinase